MKNQKTHKINNNYQSGRMSFLVISEKKKFVGICLEFDLEAEGKTPEEAMERIRDLAQAWLENIMKNKLPLELLNRPTLDKYWDYYEEAKIITPREVSKIQERSETIPVFSGSQLYTPQFPRVLFA